MKYEEKLLGNQLAAKRRIKMLSHLSKIHGAMVRMIGQIERTEPDEVETAIKIKILFKKLLVLLIIATKVQYLQGVQYLPTVVAPKKRKQILQVDR